MPPELLQLAGSLIAILALAWIAARLGLGGDVRLRDEAQVRRLAEEAQFGFDPVATAIDRAGLAALVRDDQGRIMLLRRHGARFAARLLDSHAHVRLDRNFLVVGTGDRQFGQITLDLGAEASAWAASLRRI